MKTMKTLVVDEKGKLSIQNAPIPTYNEYEALVKMVSCGVCNGTDAKIIHGAFKGFTYERDYPLMLGHEGVGRVVEVGAKVTGLKVGDIVLLPFSEDNSGKLSTAWGAFSQYGVVSDSVALSENGFAVGSENFSQAAYAQSIVPPDIDPVDASIIVTLREVLSSIKTFGIKENNSVVVFGCGPVGLTFIKFMNLLGVNPIIAFDIDDKKVENALKNGATYAYNSNIIRPTKAVHDICPDGVDFTIDAVGKLDLINESLGLIRDRGMICCYGISPQSSMQLDWSKAPYNWVLNFQQMPSKMEEYEANSQVVAWLRAGIIDMKDYISDYVSFDDVLTAFEKLERNEIAYKCIVKFE